MAKRNPSTGKAPAFQFYPGDFLADEDQTLMTLAECGLYIRLLCLAWGNGSIPSQCERIATLVGATVDDVRSAWTAVSVCFVNHPTDPGRLVNPRMERERIKQRNYRRKQAVSANMRWHPKRNANALQPQSDRNALILSSLVLSEVQEKSAPSRAAVDRKRPERKTASNPTYANMKAWTAECHEAHGDQCKNQREHLLRMQLAAQSKAEAS